MQSDNLKFELRFFSFLFFLFFNTRTGEGYATNVRRLQPHILRSALVPLVELQINLYPCPLVTHNSSTLFIIDV